MVAAPAAVLEPTRSAIKRKNKHDQKRKRHLAENQAALEAAAEDEEGGLVMGSKAAAFTVAAGVVAGAAVVGGERDLGAALQVEKELRLFAEAKARAAQLAHINSEAAVACGFNNCFVLRLSADNKHLVQMPSGICVLAPGKLDADAVAQTVGTELLALRRFSDVSLCLLERVGLSRSLIPHACPCSTCHMLSDFLAFVSARRRCRTSTSGAWRSRTRTTLNHGSSLRRAATYYHSCRQVIVSILSNHFP